MLIPRGWPGLRVLPHMKCAPRSGDANSTAACIWNLPERIFTCLEMENENVKRSIIAKPPDQIQCNRHSVMRNGDELDRHDLFIGNSFRPLTDNNTFPFNLISVSLKKTLKITKDFTL